MANLFIIISSSNTIDKRLLLFYQKIKKGYWNK
jgi:hypothetical protein